MMDAVTQRKVDEYNARGQSRVVHWEPCQTCPTCGLLCDGYRREDGTCFVICEACDARRIHLPECPYLRALACPVAVECQHGHDVCPECDACTCKRGAT